MKIAYFINAKEIHSLKWIAEICKTQDVVLFTHFSYNNSINDLLAEFKIIATVYYLLPDRYSFFRLFKKRRINKKIKQILHKDKVDIVHSMFIEPYSFYAAKTGFKHIITTRGSDILLLYNKKDSSLYLKFIRFLFKMQYRSVIKKAAFITCTSEAQKEKVLEICKYDEKVKVIPTGISLSLFNHRANLKLPYQKKEREFYLFCPRAWRKLYNIDLLADSIVQINENSNLDETLILILLEFGAEPAYKQQIEKIINKKPEYFKVFPSQAMAETPAFYSSANAVIMIPDSDGTPNSALEAFAMKKPVILGKAGYDPEFFNSETAYFINEYSKESIEKGIINAVLSDEKKRIIQNAFKTVVEKASLKSSIEKLNEIYMEVLEK